MEIRWSLHSTNVMTPKIRSWQAPGIFNFPSLFALWYSALTRSVPQPLPLWAFWIWFHKLQNGASGIFQFVNYSIKMGIFPTSAVGVVYKTDIPYFGVFVDSIRTFTWTHFYATYRCCRARLCSPLPSWSCEPDGVGIPIDVGVNEIYSEPFSENPMVSHGFRGLGLNVVRMLEPVWAKISPQLSPNSSG